MSIWMEPAIVRTRRPSRTSVCIRFCPKTWSRTLNCMQGTTLLVYLNLCSRSRAKERLLYAIVAAFSMQVGFRASRVVTGKPREAYQDTQWMDGRSD